MGQRVAVGGEPKPLGAGAAKASPNRAPFQSPAADPKPGDLAMGRLKVG